LWGRRCADQPDKVMQLVDLKKEQPTSPQTLDELIADRMERLKAYQSGRYAKLYKKRVEKVRAIDKRAQGRDSITGAMAISLYKLMAYKDEYEVGRLYSDGKFLKKLQAQFEGDYELRFNMAPPLFSKRDPNTGHLIKSEFGPWMIKAFSMLAKFKFLRGTPFDVFGHSEERKQERADIAQYEVLLDSVLEDVSDDNYEVAVEIARLPEKLRGYGHVKDRNREKMKVLESDLLARLQGRDAVPVVQLFDAA
jgi:indolepyruvate ferredoxin oxidoreductase